MLLRKCDIGDCEHTAPITNEHDIPAGWIVGLHVVAVDSLPDLEKRKVAERIQSSSSIIASIANKIDDRIVRIFSVCPSCVEKMPKINNNIEFMSYTLNALSARNQLR